MTTAISTEVNGRAVQPAAPQSASLAVMTTSRPALGKALSEAVAACHSVEKGSRNDYHQYDYASADAIIEVGRSALSGAGLALLPMEASLIGSDREGPDRYELVRTFLLLHQSGESVPLRVTWPVCPEKGRPLDKATAAADTLSLSYLLRDLLLMPRVASGDDVNARDDRQAAPPQQRRPAKQEKPDPTTGAEFAARIKAQDDWAAKDGRLPAGAVTDAIEKYGLSNGWGEILDQWPAEAWRLGLLEGKEVIKRAKGKQASPPAKADDKAEVIGPDKLARLNAEMNRTGEKWSHLAAFLADKHGTPKNVTPNYLTVDQYRAVMDALGETPNAPKNQPA